MVKLLYYATNTKEELKSNFSFIPENNVFSFVCEKFVFNIIINDYIELKEFYNFLTKLEKKIILTCYLKKEKIYKGKRKFLWKKDNIAVSQGGIRLEFGKDIQELFINIIKKIIF